MPKKIPIPTNRIAPYHLPDAPIRTTDPPDAPGRVAGDLPPAIGVAAQDVVVGRWVIDYRYHGIRRVYHEDVACFHGGRDAQLAPFRGVVALREVRVGSVLFRDGRAGALGRADGHFTLQLGWSGREGGVCRYGMVW